MFAYDRLANGDMFGALLETLSAGFDLIHSLSLVVSLERHFSVGIDAYMFARDFVPEDTRDRGEGGQWYGTWCN